MKTTEIKGIKQVTGMSKSLKGYDDPMYLSVFYTVPDNRIFAVYMVSIGYNAWVECDHKNILFCGNIYEPATQEELANMVFFAK